MKKLLLSILFITALSNAQNSISIVSIPTEVNQGATFDVVFEYTSDAVGTYELQFIPMNADGQPVWDMGNVAFVSEPIAVNATATQVTASVTIPSDITLTTNLTSPAVAWGLFAKLTGNSETFLSPYPTVNVIAGEVVTDPTGTIAIADFPTEVARGSTFDITFEYTANFVGTYELQLIPMGDDGQPVWSMSNAFFASDAIAVNADATQVTVPITIPDDITLSTGLEAPAVAWGLFGKLADSNGDVAYLSPYPQTTVSATLSVRNNVFDTKTIFYNSSLNSLEINTNKIEAKTLQIYSITGKMVMNIKDAKLSSSVDVSSLSKGIYFVRSESKFLKFIK